MSAPIWSIAGATRSRREEARFLVLRGAPGFQPDQPFRRQGRDFSIAWSEGYDDSSTVLRRWLGVTCRVAPR